MSATLLYESSDGQNGYVQATGSDASYLRSLYDVSPPHGVANNAGESREWAREEASGKFYCSRKALIHLGLSAG